MPTQAGCCCGDPVRGLSSERCGGPGVGPCPTGREAGLSPRLQMGPAPARSLVTRSWRSGAGAADCWVVRLGVALLKAAGHRPWGLEGGATCTPKFLPLFPPCSLPRRASLLAAPSRGVLSRLQTPTPYWAREGALFGVITPQCQLLGLHCSGDTAACARPPLTALGLPCRLSAPLGERTARAFGI